MTNNELKSIANRLSDAYITAPDEFANNFNTIMPKAISVRDGYVIGRLMDVYREVKQGCISIATAKNEQKDIFEKSVLIDA